MRTVLSTPRRPSFRLGLTPSAQTQFTTASRQTTALYNDLLTQISLRNLPSDDPRQAQWFQTLDNLLHEADAIVTAAGVADDTGLPALLNSLTSVRNRMQALSQEWATLATTEGDLERSTQRGWLIGAGAVVLGLVAGFAWLSFSKRS